MLCHSNLVVFTSWQLALLMTFSKFKNQLSVLSPALPTILILNLSLKSCKSYPSPPLPSPPLPDLILFNKLQFMQSFNQNFLPSSFNDTWVKNSIRNIGENDIQLCNFDQLCLFLFLFLFQFVPKHTGSFAAVHHFHIFQLFQI